MNKNLVKLLQVNQQKNLNSVFQWFDSIENESQGKFTQMDIAEIYPSISEEMLDNAILFAQQYNAEKDETKTLQEILIIQ